MNVSNHKTTRPQSEHTPVALGFSVCGDLDGRFENFSRLNVSKSVVRKYSAFAEIVAAAFEGFVGVTEGVAAKFAASSASFAGFFAGLGPSIESNRVSTSLSISIPETLGRKASLKKTKLHAMLVCIRKRGLFLQNVIFLTNLRSTYAPKDVRTFFNAANQHLCKTHLS